MNPSRFRGTFVLALPLVASLAIAQQPLQRPLRGAPAPSLAKSPELDAQHTSYRLPHDQLYLSAQADGSPQVRARSYKAEFTPGAATYIPFCGSAAPQNHPLGLRLESIRAGAEPVAFDASVVATRDGQRVRYARGGVNEVYELGLDSLEQTFVFDALPSSGELALRLAVATDLGASREGDALVFTSTDGSVRYGAATVVDAHGASAPAATELVDGGIEIRVPAAFLARAAFPITIDPVITTFGVSFITEPVDSFSPNIAWDDTNQRYCVVYEEVFSATDHDSDQVFVSSTGTFQSGAYVDTNLGDYWATPDVANNNFANNFFVVASVGIPSSGGRTIHGRTLDAGSGTLGSDVLVSTTDQAGEKVEPSVGGDPFLGTAAYFTVVWTRLIGGDYDVHMRQVGQTGGLLGTSTILIADGPSSWDYTPRISKSCQGPGTHHVVWDSMVNFGDFDIAGAEIAWNGAITIPATPLVTGSATTTRPACSPINNNGSWLLVYEYDYTTDHDIFGQLMSGLTTTDTQSLSGLEHSLGTGMLFEDQINAAADTDGVHFAYSCAESYQGSTTDYDTKVTTLDVINNRLQVGEMHQSLGFSVTHEDFPRMCSQQASGGVGNTLAITWSDTGGANLGNIEAGIYNTGDFTKFCTANYYGVQSCPCGNFPMTLGRGCENSSFTGGASINGSGNASLSSDSAVLSTSGEKPTATSVLMQGPTLVGAGVTFGQGVRCVGGSLKRLYAKTASGGSMSAPGGGDPSIHTRSATLGDPLAAGSVRYYFVYYRDPVVLGGCPAASTFNTSDAIQVVWRP